MERKKKESLVVEASENFGKIYVDFVVFFGFRQSVIFMYVTASEGINGNGNGNHQHISPIIINKLAQRSDGYWKYNCFWVAFNFSIGLCHPLYRSMRIGFEWHFNCRIYQIPNKTFISHQLFYVFFSRLCLLFYQNRIL